MDQIGSFARRLLLNWNCAGVSIDRDDPGFRAARGVPVHGPLRMRVPAARHAKRARASALADLAHRLPVFSEPRRIVVNRSLQGCNAIAAVAMLDRGCEQFQRPRLQRQARQE